MATCDKQTLDFTKLPFPPTLDDAVLTAESKTIDVTVAGKTLQIYTEQVVKESNQPSLDLLFLHGMRFTSKNWLDIKTVYHVANWGYRAVAIDLPGYGKSVNTLEPEHNAEFLKSAIATLGLHKPVIISPSMSGGFALPYLFDDPSTSMDRAVAYVPVAPVFTEKFVEQFKKSQIPTLIVVGTNDTINGEESTANLRNLPNSCYAPIEGASHPCYLDNPDAFHSLLYYFLEKVRA